jgi:hypothetical protein
LQSDFLGNSEVAFFLYTLYNVIQDYKNYDTIQDYTWHYTIHYRRLYNTTQRYATLYDTT